MIRPRNKKEGKNRVQPQRNAETYEGQGVLMTSGILPAARRKQSRKEKSFSYFGRGKDLPG
jgi:hypothetical protein